MQLILPVKSEYFDQMVLGQKTFEYRLRTPYWRKRLEGKQFDKVVVTKGYPKRDDGARRLECIWSGYEEHTLTHPHFGPDPVEVFSIYINPLYRSASECFAARPDVIAKRARSKALRDAQRLAN